MKKLFFYATSAAMILASCSNDDFVGETKVSPNEINSQAIAFGSGFKSVTRADAVGADAAAKLGEKFIVSGYKKNGTDIDKVFDNYIVNWSPNTAGTTESNTSDWEYVGVTAAAPSAVTGLQTIKYWDYSTSQYDFAAYSVGENALGAITVTSINKKTEIVEGVETYKGLTYTLTGSAENLAKCYISDLVTVKKADYQKEVTLNFRSLGSKIRFQDSRGFLRDRARLFCEGFEVLC